MTSENQFFWPICRVILKNLMLSSCKMIHDSVGIHGFFSFFVSVLSRSFVDFWLLFIKVPSRTTAPWIWNCHKVCIPFFSLFTLFLVTVFFFVVGSDIILSCNINTYSDSWIGWPGYTKFHHVIIKYHSHYSFNQTTTTNDVNITVTWLLEHLL